MLKTGRNNVITFELKEALAFDGFTGPYLQYTVSRINSILKKETAKNLTNVNFGQLVNHKEKELLVLLAQFSGVTKTAALTFEPSQLAQYLFEVAKAFSSYYQEIPILAAEPKTKEARLALIATVRQILVNGLSLLGIETLERM